MKLAKQILGGFLLMAGLIAMAGSAGDCDGHCMENANTISEMIMISFIGLTMFVTGAILFLNEEGK